MPDIDSQEELIVGAPSFSFDSFQQEYNTEPAKFMDLFGDKSILIKVLTEGKGYPDTGSLVRVHFVGKREDGNIFESTLALDKPHEFRLYSGESLPCINWAVATMRLGSEILVRTTHVHAYGEVGHPPMFAPKESLLFFIRFIDAKNHAPTPEEMEELNKTTPQDKIKIANQYKECGINFYSRGMFKLAHDQFWCAFRIIKYKPDKWKKLEKPTRKEIKQLRCKLFCNFAAFYVVHEMDWEQVIKYCSRALTADPNCVVALARRSRAYTEIEKFEKAKEDYTRALDLDKLETEKVALHKARERYNQKHAVYLEKRRIMEENIGKGICKQKQEN